MLEPRGRNLERNRDLLYVGLLVLYIALVGFGNAVATSVTEEKSSRVVELLLTTLSPRRLLAGKVLGVGLLGLAQLLLAGGAALAAGQLAGGAGLPSAAPEAVALVAAVVRPRVRLLQRRLSPRSARLSPVRRTSRVRRRCSPRS